MLICHYSCATTRRPQQCSRLFSVPHPKPGHHATLQKATCHPKPTGYRVMAHQRCSFQRVQRPVGKVGSQLSQFHFSSRLTLRPSTLTPSSEPTHSTFFVLSLQLGQNISRLPVDLFAATYSSQLPTLL